MQKFSQIYLKKLKNSKITPKKIKNTNSQKFKQSPKFCHTERSEVSTQIIENRLLNAKFMDISLTLNMTIWIFLLRLAPCNPLGRFVLTHFTQNDKIRRHCKMTKCVFFVRHCERARRAWQSTRQRQR